MPPLYTQADRPFGFVLSLIDRQSVQEAHIKAGHGVLPVGRVLSREVGQTAFMPWAPGRMACAILGDVTDTGTDPLASAVIAPIVDHAAVVRREGLRWPESATEAQKRQALSELYARLIIAPPVSDIPAPEIGTGTGGVQHDPLTVTFEITDARETLFVLPQPARTVSVYLNGLRERYFLFDGESVLLEFEPLPEDEILIEYVPRTALLGGIVEPGILEPGIVEEVTD